MKKLMIMLFAILLLLSSCGTKESTKEKEASVSSSTSETISLEDPEAFSTKYLYAPLMSGVLAQSWSDPTEVAPDTYMNYYVWSGDAGKPEYPEEEVESMIMSHFDVTSAFLRTAAQYHPDKKAYISEGIGGAGGIKVLSSSANGDVLELQYGIFDIDDKEETIVWEGTVQIRRDGHAYQYLSNTSGLDK